MNEKDIARLFAGVAGEAGGTSEEVNQIFSILVGRTLTYRDHLKARDGTVLTVEDVRGALQYLQDTLTTKRYPQTDNSVRLNLVKLWIDELMPYL